MPSTNTTIERVIFEANLARLFQIEFALTRLKVTTIANTGDSQRQFGRDLFVAAAVLLADANPSAISWTGTSGCWLGIDYDAEVLSAIRMATGVSVSSATVGLLATLEECAPASVAVLTPYEAAIHEAVLAAHRSAGFDVRADRCFGLTDNASFAAIPDATVHDAVAQLSEHGLVSVVCTNLCALLPGNLVVDSTISMLWHAIAAADPSRDLLYRDFYAAVAGAGIGQTA